MGLRKKELSQCELKRILRYDCESGHFFWLERTLSEFKSASRGKAWNTKYAGTVAGTDKGDGYITISIHKKLYAAHRLAWLYTHRQLPPEFIDHVNRIRNDNRLSNLRLASHAENRRNRGAGKNSCSGIKGVFWDYRTDKWIARGNADHKIYWLGRHENIADAILARIRFEQEHHGEFSHVC